MFRWLLWLTGCEVAPARQPKCCDARGLLAGLSRDRAGRSGGWQGPPASPQERRGLAADANLCARESRRLLPCAVPWKLPGLVGIVGLQQSPIADHCMYKGRGRWVAPVSPGEGGEGRVGAVCQEPRDARCSRQAPAAGRLQSRAIAILLAQAVGTGLLELPGFSETNKKISGGLSSSTLHPIPFTPCSGVASHHWRASGECVCAWQAPWRRANNRGAVCDANVRTVGPSQQVHPDPTLPDPRPHKQFMIVSKIPRFVPHSQAQSGAHDQITLPWATPRMVKAAARAMSSRTAALMLKGVSHGWW